jgi:hypothetical protein
MPKSAEENASIPVLRPSPSNESAPAPYSQNWWHMRLPGGTVYSAAKVLSNAGVKSFSDLRESDIASALDGPGKLPGFSRKSAEKLRVLAGLPKPEKPIAEPILSVADELDAAWAEVDRRVGSCILINSEAAAAWKRLERAVGAATAKKPTFTRR